jgi:hypothetical protein
VSNFLDDLSTFAECLSAFEKTRISAKEQSGAIDIRNALLDYQIPSDEALQQAFEPAIRRNGQWPAIPTTTPNLNAKSILQRRCTSVAFGSYPT